MDNVQTVSSKKEYFERIDILKGIGIILMVLGHAGFPYTHFICLFHMSIFFIASGYCWNDKNCTSVSSCKKYIIRKILTLYIPFVLCNVIFMILNNVFIDLNIYTDDPNLIKQLGDSYENGLKAYMTPDDMFRSFIKILLMVEGTRLGGATWFLRTLFVVSVGNCILQYIWGKLNIRRKWLCDLIIFILCIVTYEVYRMKIIDLPISSIMTLVIGYEMFIIGTWIRNVEKKYETKSEIKWWNVFLSIIILLVFERMADINFAGASVENSIVFLLASLSGWTVIIWISDIIKKFSFSKVFIFVGKNTLPVVLLHFLAFKAVTYIYLAITERPLKLLAAFPVIESEWWLWIVYSVVGVFFPICIYILYKEIKMKILYRK